MFNNKIKIIQAIGIFLVVCYANHGQSAPVDDMMKLSINDFETYYCFAIYSENTKDIGILISMHVAVKNITTDTFTIFVASDRNVHDLKFKLFNMGKPISGVISIKPAIRAGELISFSVKTDKPINLVEIINSEKTNDCVLLGIDIIECRFN